MQHESHVGSWPAPLDRANILGSEKGHGATGRIMAQSAGHWLWGGRAELSAPNRTFRSCFEVVFHVSPLIFSMRDRFVLTFSESFRLFHITWTIEVGICLQLMVGRFRFFRVHLMFENVGAIDRRVIIGWLRLYCPTKRRVMEVEISIIGGFQHFHNPRNHAKQGFVLFAESTFQCTIEKR